jgi:hypothetical protein
MRRAWKVRVAGWMRSPGLCPTARATSSASWPVVSIGSPASRLSTTRRAMRRERRVVAEAEAALRRVELERRDAEVGQDAGRPRLARLQHHAPDLFVDGVDGAEARAEAGQPFGGQPQRLRVAVYAEHPRRGRGFENRLAVPAEAERRVHEEPAARGSEQRDRLRQQHGAMGRARPPSGLRHYHRPVVSQEGDGRKVFDFISSHATFLDSEPSDGRLVLLRVGVGGEPPLETLKLPDFQVCQISEDGHVAHDGRRLA